tara:strand:+ start:210 stop:434 length:225 start_codon:yes stop_codon:yes gene_type:complete
VERFKGEAQTRYERFATGLLHEKGQVKHRMLVRDGESSEVFKESLELPFAPIELRELRDGTGLELLRVHAHDED